MDPTDRAHLERFGKLVTVLFRAYGTPIDEDTIEGTYESECGPSEGTWRATRANP